MSMSTKNHDALNMCRERCNFMDHQLTEVANALRRIGMTDLAKELDLRATVASEVASTIHEVTGKIINDDLREAQELTATMLKATLAGIAVAKEGEKP